MPYVDKPRSDTGRLTWIRLTAETGAQDHTQGKTYLPELILNQVAVLAPTYQAAVIQVDEKLAGRARETAERRFALGNLETHVRDYWQGLLRRTARLDNSVEVLRLHGLPLDGPLPHPTRSEEWIVWAQRVAAGDAAAVEANFPPMCNPTSAEVQAALEAALAESADVSDADRALDDAQASLAELRAQADDLIDQVVLYLQLALRKLDPPSQRRIMRTYGVVFTKYQDEVLPEEA